MLSVTKRSRGNTENPIKESTPDGFQPKFDDNYNEFTVVQSKLTALLKLNFNEKLKFQNYLAEINIILDWYKRECSNSYTLKTYNCAFKPDKNNQFEIMEKHNENKNKFNKISSEIDEIATFTKGRLYGHNASLKEAPTAAPAPAPAAPAEHITTAPTTGGKKRKSLKKRRKSKRKSLKKKRKTQRK